MRLACVVWPIPIWLASLPAVAGGIVPDEPRSGIDLEARDTSVSPREDFYRYAVGGWLDDAEIPSDRAVWGSFHELREVSEERVLEIVRDAADAENTEDRDRRRMGDLFRSFMDSERLDALGLEPLEDDLARIDAIGSQGELAVYWGERQAYGHGLPVSLRVGPDQGRSDRYVTFTSQSGLGLPDREYYLRDGERDLELRERYREFIRELWTLAGWDNASEAVENVLDVETRLAEEHWTRVRNRDRRATYNLMSVVELTELAPGFDWETLLEAADLGEIEELVVRQPSYFEAFADLYGEIEIAAWRDYLRFHLIRANASCLSSEFDRAAFDFYGRVLNGQEEQRDREKRAASAVERVFGFLVGEAYTERHFPDEAAERMDDMIGRLREAFDETIRELDWMGEQTKAAALAKLDAMRTKIGHPDEWRDYDCVEIDPEDLIGNLRNSARCEYRRNLDRLGEEVDREEWHMTPQTVNAYYNSSLNEIVFPAAILQPPFFDVKADDAVNYGAIGAVIGHEISHGFDDQGRRFDADGNLNDWWTETDEERFTALAARVVEHYGAFNPIDDLYLQGDLGLGENIADLGGVNVAYRAYRASLDGEEPPVIDGYTGDQRFFMGYAGIWRMKYRDEALRRRVMTGQHSPGRYRVIGVVVNMPEFHEAFDVEPGDPMYLDEEDRVRIW